MVSLHVPNGRVIQNMFSYALYKFIIRFLYQLENNGGHCVHHATYQVD